MEENKPDIYPMILFPTFEVRDIEASVDWYTRILNFSLIFGMKDDQHGTRLAHVRRLKHQDILLVARTDSMPDDPAGMGRGVTITCAFADEPGDHISALDAFAARIAHAGAVILEGPMDRPWNTRDVVVRDPDGYRLAFTTPDFARMRDFGSTL
ncbi:MAG: VOC family protein [Methanomicrobiaceae archaeon]|nr:VOC family protein [Methanomicrobiaceae archaeon]